MGYRDIVSLNKSFQYSINLQYDLLNLEKVKGYIPTRQSVNILKEYLTSVVKDDSDKATVLIGPYGKGKSHLLLVLMSILYSKDKSIKTRLLNRIKAVDIETYDLANKVFSDKKKLLPVVINSNNLDLKQSFLIALNDAIKREELEDIKLNTYFDTVIEIVELWENSYPETLKLLENELVKFELNLDTFIKNLREYSNDAYNIFTNIYPLIASGLEFNPMVSTDIVKLYEEFNNEICDKHNYKGMFIVFDEFSKFIEGSVDRNNSAALKMLQDFAELSNRSKDNQMHLACITHKSINQYISKIPTSKVDAWRAIEGRFKEIQFTTSSKQNFELIENTIIGNEEEIEKILEEEILKENSNKGYEIFNSIYSYKEYEKFITKGCFPLNSITTYCLPRISEKVAQNERTLFTFLCKKGKSTLSDFIKNCQVGELLNIDVLYDYFEELFKKELFNEKIKEVWAKTNSAIKKVEDEDEIKILKGIAIINIVDAFEKIEPTKHNLGIAFPQINVDEIIEGLISKGLLIERKNNNLLDYMPGVSIDINRYIDDVAKTKFKRVNISEVLNNKFTLGYITPKRFNDEFKMTRFFENRFINIEELMVYENLDELVFEAKSDGVIINIIYENKEDIEKLKDKISGKDYPNIIINIPNRGFEKNVELLKLMSVQYLKEDIEFINKDTSIIQYLDIIEEDLEEVISKYLEETFEVENGNSEIILNGEVKKIQTQVDLNRNLSEICENVYSRTVKINNEMINKNKITTPILKARTKIIEGIFNDDLLLEGNSPEVTIAKATILNKGLQENEDVSADLKEVLNYIRNKILESENSKISFEIIYDYLENFRYGIGMRKGVIPIYIAKIIKEFEDKIVIYYGQRSAKEIEVESSLFNEINIKPNEYFFKLDIGTKEKEEYFNKLEELFSEYNFIKGKSTKYFKLVSSMQEWMKSLDKFTRAHNKVFEEEKLIAKELISMRSDLLRYDINSRGFIFEVLPKIFKETDLEKTYEKIYQAKRYFDNRSNEIKIKIIKWTKDSILDNYNGSFSQALIIWNEKLDKFKKEYLYDVVTNKFIEFTSNIKNNNDEVIINELAFIFTGLSIGDWNDESYENYKKQFIISLNKIEKLEETKDLETMSTVIFKVEGESNIEKRFSKQEISPIGNTLLNELEEVVDEYGAALSDNEKRTILLNLLEKLM